MVPRLGNLALKLASYSTVAQFLVEGALGIFGLIAPCVLNVFFTGWVKLLLITVCALKEAIDTANNKKSEIFLMKF